MSEIVERVARALFEAQNPNASEWPEQYPRVRVRFREYARAAIEAMRFPENNMPEAMTKCFGENWGVARGTWNAMIDDALKET